ncbi:hypothetical protein E3N88_15486 [Mikania micrantha]|uniref:Uncharacterized protein n=1 Tax=Mikania micrantha TaxID=192012 RepID=A0A5N6NYB8_9ASTR|nr:hypothetical protein E3N88_15486 [Mikania micrantha]
MVKYCRGYYLSSEIDCLQRYVIQGTAKTVRKTELRIVRNHETKKIFKVLNFWTRRGTRRRFEDPSRYATDLKYLKSSGFLRGTRSPFWLLVATIYRRRTQAKHPPNNLLKPSDRIFEARERVYKS